MIALSLLKTFDNQTWPIVTYGVIVIVIGTVGLILLRRTVSARHRAMGATV